MRPIVVILLTALVGVGPLAADDLTQAAESSNTEISHWSACIDEFGQRVDDIFARASNGQRDMIRRRVQYVQGQTLAERQALVRLQQAKAAFDAGGEGLFGLAGDRNQRMVELVEAFRAYRALFSADVQRAFVDHPMPRFERLFLAWRAIPWYHTRVRQKAREELEACLVPYATDFVQRTQKAANVRRGAFYHALKNLQFSSSILDFTLAYKFDKAFYTYQALYSGKAEPGYGVPSYPDFPVTASLEFPIEFKANDYSNQFAKAFSDRSAQMPGAVGRRRGASSEGLSLEAERIRELHELTARYERASQRGDTINKDEIWTRYCELRDRWDRSQ